MNQTNLDRARRRLRARALANLLGRLGQQAADSHGRFSIERRGQDLILLGFRDVWTLIRNEDDFHRERVDFRVLISIPDEWPWNPAGTIIPMVLKPNGWAHPNSDSRFLCMDLAGVLPERVATLLYDNLRLARFRLDDPVDRRVADYVRAHLSAVPTDRRGLFPGESER